MRFGFKPNPKPDPKSIQLGQKFDSSSNTDNLNQRSHPYGMVTNGRRYVMMTQFSQTGSN
jgi:hypothetical protein